MNTLKATLIGTTLAAAGLGASGVALAGYGYGPGMYGPGMYGPAFRHPGPGYRYDDPEERMDYLSDYLDLSAEQRKALTSIFADAHDRRRDLHEKLHDLRRDIRDALDEEDIDSAAIDRLADKQGKLVAERTRLRAQTWKKVRDVLDKKQLRRMRDMRHEGYGYRNYGYLDYDYRDY